MPATRIPETGALRMNSKDIMQGSAIPMKQHTIQTAAWSRTICLIQPRQRFRFCSVGRNAWPTWERVTVLPPTALAMAPTLAPMPQPLSRA